MHSGAFLRPDMRFIIQFHKYMLSSFHFDLFTPQKSFEEHSPKFERTVAQQKCYGRLVEAQRSIDYINETLVMMQSLFAERGNITNEQIEGILKIRHLIEYQLQNAINLYDEFARHRRNYITHFTADDTMTLIDRLETMKASVEQLRSVFDEELITTLAHKNGDKALNMNLRMEASIGALQALLCDISNAANSMRETQLSLERSINHATAEEYEQRLRYEYNEVVNHHSPGFGNYINLCENILTKMRPTRIEFTIQTPFSQRLVFPHVRSSVEDMQELIFKQIQNIYPNITQSELEDSKKLAIHIHRNPLNQEQSNTFMVGLAYLDLLNKFKTPEVVKKKAGRKQENFFDFIDQQSLADTFFTFKESVEQRHGLCLKTAEYTALYLCAFFRRNTNDIYGKATAIYNALKTTFTDKITIALKPVQEYVRKISAMLRDSNKCETWTTRTQNAFHRYQLILDTLSSLFYERNLSYIMA